MTGLASASASTRTPRAGRPGWINRLVSSRSFQRWAARFPLTRGIVRREGEAMFDLVAGFCHSQILQALVGLGIIDKLGTGRWRCGIWRGPATFRRSGWRS